MIIDNSTPENRHDKAVVFLAATAIIGSALHFWPFSSSPIWKLVNVGSVAVILGLAKILLGTLSGQISRRQITQALPPPSIWAYLIVHILSCAYADTLSRPALYTFKVFLIMVGAYLLIAFAFYKSRLPWIPWAIVLACSIGIVASLYSQYVLKEGPFGFFESAYKFGTYTAIMASFAVMFLLSQRKVWSTVAALVLVFASGLTFKTLGGWAGMMSGLVAGFIIFWKELTRVGIGAAIAVCVVTTICFNAAVVQDLKIKEGDDENLRQRYIEWQAEINMLQTYGITGSGAGSINDHRSHYYSRMPKLNTLQPFDQNGWLAVTAEIGLLGLLCFIWVIIEHGSSLLRGRALCSVENKRVNAALFSALVAACVANIFSSVNYHGILICFVAVLAMSRSAAYKGA